MLPCKLSPAEPFIVVSRRDDGYGVALPSMRTPIKDFIKIEAGVKGICLYEINTGIRGMWWVMLEDGRQLIMDDANLQSTL